MKIKLWSIQNECGWHELNTKGVLRGNKDYVDKDFKEAYDWMKIQMKQRIGSPNHPNQYPVWAWYQHQNAKKKKPDLRTSAHLPSGSVGYRIEIEKNATDVLLSDFDLWHTPLAYKTFIANNEKERLEFESLFSDLDYQNLPAHAKKQVEKSWEKIFDMHFQFAYYAEPYPKKIIQATFWELHHHEIVKVDKFKAR